MFSFPHQYLNRIAQAKLRRDKESEKPEGQKNSLGKAVETQKDICSRLSETQKEEKSHEQKFQQAEACNTANELLKVTKVESRDEKSSQASKDFNQLMVSK